MNAFIIRKHYVCEGGIILTWTRRYCSCQTSATVVWHSVKFFLVWVIWKIWNVVFVCVCVCVCVCQRKTKDRADGMRKKVPIPLDGIRTCTSGIRAHCASDYTTRVRPPCVSRNKHFRHSPVSSTAKQSCMKHSNSYLRDRDVKHLQGPPLSWVKRVRERRKTEPTVWGKKCPFPSTGFEPVPLRYAPTVLPITPRG